MKTYTKGPWEYKIGTELDKTWAGNYSFTLNGILSFGWDGEEGIYLENEADGHLIAAAPDLLERLKDAQALIRRLDPTTIYGDIDYGIKRAIDKAEGIK